MALAGGAADKAGNRYERRWTVRAMQRLLFTTADTLRVEVPGAEGAGSEFKVTIGSTVEWTQTKLQNSRGNWTLAALDNEGFLQDWLPKLRAGQRCSFASMTSADELRQLCNRARDAVDIGEFEREFLKDGRDKHFARMKRLWGGIDSAEAYQLLRLIEVETMDEKNLDETLDLGMRLLATGSPQAARNVLLQYADEIIHSEIAAADVWAHLKNNEILPAPSLVSTRLSEPLYSDERWLAARLNKFPPVLHQRLHSAMAADPTGTRRLITSLSGETRPTSVVSDWEAYPPTWLYETEWQTQLAAAELSLAFDGSKMAARIYRHLADQGMPPRHLWLARAAMQFATADDIEGRDDALNAYGGCASSDHPYACALAAVFDNRPDEADRHLQDWEPTDPADKTAKAILSVQIALGHPDQDQFSNNEVDAALARSAKILDVLWFSGLAIWRARSLTLRARQRRSPTMFSDLREAQNLAIRARDERRAWGGDSPTAVALACQAAGVRGDLDFVLRTGLTPDMGGIATAEESANSAVSEQVAFAALQLRLFEMAEFTAKRVTAPFARQRTDALIAQFKGDSSEHLWRAAVGLAEDDEQLVQALIGLAKTGITDLPRLDELRRRHPESADEIEATADLAAGEANRSIARLRGQRRQSLTAALTLADAYEDINDVESAIQTLLDAAFDFNDPQPRLFAAATLAREGRTAEAEGIISDLLSDPASDWPDRPEVLKLAAQLAFESADLNRAVHLTRAALQADGRDVGVRWALIQALMILDQLSDAWSAMTDVPDQLKPTTIGQAQIWVELHRQFDEPANTMSGCLELLETYGDLEDFAAFTLTAMMIPGSSTKPVPADLLGAYHEQLEAFFARWPDSPHLRRLSSSDDEELLKALTDSVRPTPELLAERRRLTREFHRGEKPLVMLAAYTGRPYSEIVIRRGMGTIPSKHPDPAESTICTATVSAAINSDVVIDTSALAVLAILPAKLRDAALALFRRVLTTDEVPRDIREYSERLDRDAGTLYYDPDRDQPALSELSDDQKTEIKTQLRLINDVVAKIVRQPVRPLTDTGNRRVRVHTSVLQLAANCHAPMWCDDAIARTMNRTIGIASFSTYSIIDHLCQCGAISLAEHRSTQILLLRERIGDPQLSKADLLEVAHLEAWEVKSAATALSRPQCWENIEQSSAIVSALLKECNQTRPDLVPVWLNMAAFGAGLKCRNTRAAVEVAALLLAGNLLTLNAQGQKASQMVAATRRAVLAALPVDSPTSIPTDPLPAAVKAMRKLMIAANIPPDTVPKAILNMLHELDATDLRLVTNSILTRDDA